MKKRELVWLIVRLTGVYLSYLAIVSVFSLISSASALYSVASTASTAKPESENVRVVPTPFPMRPETEVPAANKTDPAADKLKSEAFRTLLLYIFLTIVYGAVGIYLITNGRMLFNILNNENSFSRREHDPAVTTLDL